MCYVETQRFGESGGKLEGDGRVVGTPGFGLPHTTSEGLYLVGMYHDRATKL